MTQAFHTKYRPDSLKDVFGHEDIARAIKASVDKRSNHSYLFTGPSGTGKTTLARIIAKMLDASVQEIDAATFTGIDDMREVIKPLAYRPLDAAHKVLIVDEAHALSKAAWQSLLKSIEEPPEWVTWILCTTDVAKVPDTIKTRCTAFTLKPVPTKDIIELLEYVAKEEDILQDDIGQEILRLCAKEAGGSPRQALVYLDACQEANSRQEAAQLMSGAEVEIAEAHELAAALIKGAGWDQIKDIIEKLKEQNPESVRHVVRAYVTKVIMNSKKPQPSHFAVLEAFSKPFVSSDQMSPLILAIGGLVFGSD